MTKDETLGLLKAAQVAGILRSAADFLMAHGWIRGRMYQTDTRGHLSCCALGAIEKVSNPVMAQIVRIEFEGVTNKNLTSFNDKWGQRRRHVVAKLREAASLVEGR